MVVLKTSGHIQIKIKTPNPISGTSSTLKSPKLGLKGHSYSLHLQNQDKMPKFRSRVHQRPVSISKSRSRSQTRQEPPASFKAQNEDLKDMDILCTLKFKMESKN